MAGQRGVLVARADIDDRAAAAATAAFLREHRLDLVLHAQEHAGQVDVERRLPVLERDLGEGLRADVAIGVVDRAIEPAEAIERGLDHALDLGLDRNVGLHEHRLAAGLADQADSFLAVLGGLRRGDDFRAPAREHQRAGTAQAPAGAGHQRHLAFERLRHGHSSYREPRQAYGFFRFPRESRNSGGYSMSKSLTALLMPASSCSAPTSTSVALSLTI